MELLKEQQRQVEEADQDQEDDSETEAQQTSFVKPTVEEIKQLQEQPKKLIDKKTEWSYLLNLHVLSFPR